MERFTPPFFEGVGQSSRWYWRYKKNDESQQVLCRSSDGQLPNFSQPSRTQAAAEVFYDNLLSDDGSICLKEQAFSPCGKYFAYGLSLRSNKFFTLYVRKTSSPFNKSTNKGKKKCLEADTDRLKIDEIPNVGGASITWTHDSKGFFYFCRNNVGDPKKISKVCYHYVNTEAKKDIVVLEDDATTEYNDIDISGVGGKYLLVYTRKGECENELLWITDLNKNKIGKTMYWNKVIDKFQATYQVLGSDDTKFYLRTNHNAPRYKIITIDIKTNKLDNLIKADKEWNMEYATIVNRTYLMMFYRKDDKQELRCHSLNGALQNPRIIQLPEGVPIFVVNRRQQTEFFVQMESNITPYRIWHFNFAETNHLKQWKVYR